LIDEAVASTGALLERLEAQIGAQSEEATKTLHELKGVSRTIGAEELGALSEQAEGLARERRWDDLSRSLEGLRAAHGRFAAAAASLGDNIS
jgi:HPt (histidine-containing phosphotransfer) domain-containing protein